MNLHCVILAAGQGTRMKSGVPKVLQRLGGRPMLAHVLETAASLRPSACHVVIGHAAEAVRNWYASLPPQEIPLHWVQQDEQLGTGHAVSLAMPGIPDDARVLILYGDVPLVQSETLQGLVHQDGVTLLTTELEDPYGYGRIVRGPGGDVERSVEEKEASASERAIREVNTGMLSAGGAQLRRWLSRIDNKNSKGEYYLTDVVALAVGDGVRVTARAAPELDVQGVNDAPQLAAAERIFQRRQADALMRAGVFIADPDRFDLSGHLSCGRDVHIAPNVVFQGNVELGDRVQVGPFCLLRDVSVAEGTHIESHCVLDGARVGANTHIGPFARLRPGADLADDVHIGNFVEIKNSNLGVASKVNHLSYVGDADVGARVNVGAGVITCNYDGANKHRTVIGDDVFIGTDSQLVAPVTIGPRAYIAAGSTISQDAPADALTICRAREQHSSTRWKRPTKPRK
jgi:bifunctional UDP-N-acetylglucosamine pyrophosphorylase/glucosamine-1-phosphate N-acetyltransferase